MRRDSGFQVLGQVTGALLGGRMLIILAGLVCWPPKADT